MATRTSFNKNNSAVKRIMQEARELANDPSTEYSAAPLEDNLFEWHCTLRGAPDTDFEGGLYHFRILLPAEYPFRPPSLMMLTPSGRFETNTKLCISFTSYHEELWQPAWGVRTAIIGLQGFFPLKGQAAMGIGSMEAPGSERRRLAKLSRDWVCPQCKVPNRECLPDPLVSETSSQQGLSSKPRAQGAGDPPLEKDKANISTNTKDENGRSKSIMDGITDRCTTESKSAEHGSLQEVPSALSSSSSDRRSVEGSERPMDQQQQQQQRARRNDAERDESPIPRPAGTYSSTASTVSTPEGTGSGTTTRTTASINGVNTSSIRQSDGQVEIVSTSVVSQVQTQLSSSRNPSMSTASASAPMPMTASRPPILLDAVISVLLVLVAALLARKVL